MTLMGGRRRVGRCCESQELGSGWQEEPSDVSSRRRRRRSRRSRRRRRRRRATANKMKSHFIH